MINDEIKKANKKALPKFLLFALTCVIVGCVIGYYSGYGLSKGSTDKLTDSVQKAGAFFGENIAPWLMVAMAVIIPMVCIPIYRSAKKLLTKWDGEDENISDIISRNLSIIIWMTSASLIISYFLIAASYSRGLAIFEDKKKTIVFFASVTAFLIIMLETIIFQQKCVDKTKQMNPEKKVSFYDMRFQKKWTDDCDEAEKIIIGKCACKAYFATNVVCTILSIGLAICAPIFGIGFMPSLMVCLVWIINMSVYFKEAMRYSKIGNKIS